MLTALFISLVIAAAIAYSAQAERSGLIEEHSFNKRASDAAGARDDHLG